MPDLSAIQNRQSELIRKALEGSIFIAPASAQPITSMTTGANGALAPLPTGYVDVGMVEKKNAVTWSRKVTTTDVMTWGDIYTARRDVTKDDSQLKFTMLETKKQSLGLYYGIDMNTVTPDVTTGEVSFAQPSRPDNIYYRVFGLFQDGVGSDAIYVGRFYPRASVTDMNDQKWDDDADPLVWDIAMSAVSDSELGYPVHHYFGGPGWQKYLTAMGFTTGS